MNLLNPAMSPAQVQEKQAHAMHAHLMRRNKSFALFEAVPSLLFLTRFRQFAGQFTAQRAIFLIVFSGLLLSGCSSMRIVDSQVNSFSKFTQTPPAGASWSIERLPSQQSLEQAAAARQSKLETWVAFELAKQGFAAKPTTAGEVNYTVLIGARIQRLESGPFDDPYPFGGFGLAGRDYVVTRNGAVVLTPIWPRHTLPWYVREFSLLIRDAKSNTIVYETRAKHEGRWADEEAVLPAMVTAALQDFPKSSDGPRLVNIEIPR
jgi:Domain of unknown function (DUF4136)